jgi:hypothetical protein
LHVKKNGAGFPEFGSNPASQYEIPNWNLNMPVAKKHAKVHDFIFGISYGMYTLSDIQSINEDFTHKLIVHSG